jgi:hypothetical protein
MSKTPTLASVNGTTLSGAQLKTFLTGIVAAFRTIGMQETDRATITSDTTLTVQNCGLVLVDCTGGNVALTLPTSGSTTDDAIYNIRRIDSTSNTLALSRGGSDTIEGASSSIFIGVRGILGVQLPAGGTDWKISNRSSFSLSPGPGADIASSATINLTARTGNVVRITGTTTTTAVTMSNGDQVTCIAASAWPINISGLLTYTCSAQDVVLFGQDGSGAQYAFVFPEDGQPAFPVKPESLAEPLTSGTAQNAASGSTVTFTGIPSWVDGIDLVANRVSISGSDDFLIQIGDSGGFESSGYESSASLAGTGVQASNGFVVRNAGAPNSHSGVSHFRRVDGNIWAVSGVWRPNASSTDGGHGGSKALSDTLTQLKIVTTGSNTFDGADAKFQIYFWGSKAP